MAIKPETADTARIVPTNSWVIPALPAWSFAIMLFGFLVSGTWYVATKVQSDTEFREHTNKTHEELGLSIKKVDEKNASDTANTNTMINNMQDKLTVALDRGLREAATQNGDQNRQILLEIQNLNKGLNQLRFLYCVRDGKKCSPDGIPL